MDRVGRGPVAIDTACFIYLIEEHTTYLEHVEPLFAAVASGRVEAITSALTLLEVLVVTLRSGDGALAERYERILTRSRGLKLVDLDRTQLRAAAQLRAVHGSLRTPDALQLAAALSMRCQSFVTNDRRLPSLVGLDTISLDELA